WRLLRKPMSIAILPLDLLHGALPIGCRDLFLGSAPFRWNAGGVEKFHRHRRTQAEFGADRGIQRDKDHERNDGHDVMPAANRHIRLHLSTTFAGNQARLIARLIAPWPPRAKIVLGSAKSCGRQR